MQLHKGPTWLIEGINHVVLHRLNTIESGTVKDWVTCSSGSVSLYLFGWSGHVYTSAWIATVSAGKSGHTKISR